MFSHLLPLDVRRRNTKTPFGRIVSFMEGGTDVFVGTSETSTPRITRRRMTPHYTTTLLTAMVLSLGWLCPPPTNMLPVTGGRFSTLLNFRHRDMQNINPSQLRFVKRSTFGHAEDLVGGI
jgi:hypothetical protein